VTIGPSRHPHAAAIVEEETKGAAMTTRRPHDRTDLLLAPAALDIDDRLQELGELPPAQLAERVRLETSRQPWSRDEAQDCLLSIVTHVIDLHGWQVSFDPRGIRLFHDGHSITLGVPAVFGTYLDAIPAEPKAAGGRVG
jgi:hypothetical protein